MAIDYISREKILNTPSVRQYVQIHTGESKPEEWAIMGCDIRDFPAADVVSRDCFNRILEENDAMREQLAAIGKKPGDKMDDVVEVVRCKDCKHYNPKYEFKCVLPSGLVSPDYDDFCSKGERRDK